MQPSTLVEAKLTATKGRNIHRCYSDQRKAKQAAVTNCREYGKTRPAYDAFYFTSKNFSVFYTNRVMKHKISDTIFIRILFVADSKLVALSNFAPNVKC